MKSNFKIRTIASAILASSIVVGCGGASTSAEHVIKAEEYYANSDLKSAEIELKNALRKDEANADARFLLGKIYLESGNYVFAEAELERASTGTESNDEGRLLLARAKVGVEQGEAARELLAKVDNSNTAEVNTIYGDSYASEDSWSKAKEFYQAAIDIDASYTPALLGMVRIGLSRKDLDFASDYAEQIQQKDPQEIKGWLLDGEIDILRQDAAAARENFLKALEIDSTNFNASLGVARTLLAEDKPSEAEKYLAIAEKAQPNHPHVAYFKAEINFRSGDLEAAYNAIQQAFKIAPNYAPGQFLLGLVTYGTQRYEQAEEALSSYVAQNPEHIGARKILADTRLKLENPDGAIAVLLPVMSIAGGDPQYLALLSDAYINAGQHSKGTDTLERALELAPDAVTLRTQLAATQMLQGATDEALSNLQQVVESDEKASRADLMLVLAHIKQGDFDLAIEAADKLAEKLPDSAIVPNLKASAYLGKKDLVSARKVLNEAVELQPEFVAAHLNLAQIDIAEGDIDAARSRMKNILTFAPQNDNALEAIAQLEFDTGNVDESVQYLKRAQEANPGSIKPRVLLARLYLSQRQIVAAQTVLDELIALKPDLPPVIELKGRLALANKNYDVAVSEFRSLVDTVSDNAQFWLLYSEALGGSGRLDKAEEALTKALSLDDNDRDLKLGLARLQLRKGELDSAAQTSEDYTKQYPEDARGFALLGDVNTAQGDLSAAANSYKSAYEIDADTSFLLNWFRATSRAGDHKKAQSILTSHLKNNPKDTGVRFVLASTYQNAELFNEAIAEYEAILKDSPDYVLAMNNLAWIYADKGNKKSIRLAERANELAPNQPAILDTLGWAYYKQGKFEKARETFGLAIKLAPDMPDLRFHHALALEKLKQKNIALIEVQKALDTEKPFAERKDAEALLSRLQ